jgi:integrase
MFGEAVMSVAVRPWKKPGRWQVDIIFHKPDGERVRDQRVTEAKTESIARKWGEARETQLRAGTLTLEPKRASKAFTSFVDDDWWPVYPAKAQNQHTTVTEKKSHLDHHLKPFFGAMPLDEIEGKQIDRFAAHMSKKTIGKEADKRTSRNGKLAKPRPISAKRIKNVVGTLHTILMTAVEWGALDVIPKFPKIKITTPAFDFYNVVECAALLAAARDDEERAIIRFALHSGGRAGEQLAIERTDINTRNKFVSFSKSRTNGVTTQGTKGRKPRKIPLSESLLADIRTIRHLKGPLVFCQADGSPLTLWILRDHLARAARKAGLRLLRWHDLRHSFASNLVIGGTPIRQVQEWMGHTTILMTMRYSHLAPGGGREHLSALDAPSTHARKDSAAE